MRAVEAEAGFGRDVRGRVRLWNHEERDCTVEGGAEMSRVTAKQSWGLSDSAFVALLV